MKKLHRFYLLIFTLFLGSFSVLNAQTENSYAYAVFIAIDDYQGNNWSPLETPVADADAISNVLMTKYAFDKSIKIYDENATRRTILDTLGKITANLGENDQLLIYFSGHSINISGEGYWIPYNKTTTSLTKMISNTEVKNIMANASCKHILLMSDAIVNESVFKISDNYLKNNGSENFYIINNNMNARQVIISGNKHPITDGGSPHSVFAKYVLKVLKSNSNPLFATSELFELIKYPIAANSPNSPKLGHLQNAEHEGGQFIFPLFIKEEIVEAPIVDCSQLNLEIEEGKTITFSDDDKKVLHALTTSANVTYQWFAGVQAMTVNSPNLKISKPGEYTIVITDENNCTKAASIDVDMTYKNAYVVVAEGKEVEFTEKGTLHARTNTEGLQFVWLFNDFIAGTKSAIEINQSGTYTVNVKTNKGKVVATTTVNVKVNSRTYTVLLGDDLERLARKFYKDESKKYLIVNANKSVAENKGALKVGEILIIPALPKEQESSNIIKMASVIDLMPFSAPGIYKNGILTDISTQVFKELGMETTIEFASLTKVKSSVYTGAKTIALPIVKTPEDEANFKFSEPMYKILNVLFVKADADFDYEKEKDLKGRRIAVPKGVSIVELAALAGTGKRDVQLVPALTLEIAFQMLEKGEVDMVASPQLVGLLTLRSMTSVDVNNFKMLDKELGTEELFIAVSKNHPNADEIIANFNTTFLRLKNEGKIDEIINLHLDKYQKP